jgi:hypothetical protein
MKSNLSDLDICNAMARVEFMNLHSRVRDAPKLKVRSHAVFVGPVASNNHRIGPVILG